ncbi:MAG: 6-carboxytetrahydropterin synthase QueD [Dehalococcoidia bacterium]|nr:6-carboxytetrahydropterin synthase QueD [Dehalococcoidia bacterium]MDD5495213.1 6-carboxytetrahydropterin synthase QueD [Dehalococcoidia bacterium]
MYMISVEKSFEAAHFLRGYRGKCEKIHGHRFKVVARLRSEKLDGNGMAYDFTALKKQLAGVLDKYDHSNLNEVAPFNKINPSSENLARTIYGKLKPQFKGEVKLDSVEVWEGPESCALYRPG